MTTSSDQIVRKAVLKAPRDRVWRAISDAKQFGRWFGMAFDGEFAPGKRMTGTIVPTEADAEIAKLQEPHAGAAFELFIERIEPKQLFSFRWHPFAVDPKFDYSQEPTTLVEFALADADGGTMLTITESGFDRIPLARRAEAFASNEEGWTMQVRLIEQFLAMEAG